MRVAFRVDANAEIGLGHLMRCLALADRLAAAGACCHFLGGGDVVRARATDRHVFHSLPYVPAERLEDVDAEGAQVYAHWLPGGWRADAAACLDVLADIGRVDWLVVDHYALDRRWEEMLVPATVRLMVIDDLADRDHTCDLLLDQNLVDGMDTRYHLHVPSGCLQLLGPRYALLRPEFAASRAAAQERPTLAGVNSILVMFGGADAVDLTSEAVAALCEIAYAGSVNVVVGPLYANVATLRKSLAALPGAILHVAQYGIADLVAGADFVVGSPGVSSWERCVLGAPAAVVTVATNQAQIATALARIGAHWHLGDVGRGTFDALKAALALALHSPDSLEGMRRHAFAVCDGLGTDRVVRYLAAPAITLRPAAIEQAHLFARLAQRRACAPRFLRRRGYRFRNAHALGRTGPSRSAAPPTDCRDCGWRCRLRAF
ncbi:MAG: UDP-2,4-diacetamido-2,4,6-trideoxy-beta-L-altropyranose hydrolase [Rhodocyclaceae bacterium]|nr:UDP-2,4-diacetamido-2,4,6-trideoxy-beta-L-altropyranose hydrolase [Rhodocyclaceae bacterium]